jgi:hypothetical protein
VLRVGFEPTAYDHLKIVGLPGCLPELRPGEYKHCFFFWISY